MMRRIGVLGYVFGLIVLAIGATHVLAAQADGCVGELTFGPAMINCSGGNCPGGGVCVFWKSDWTGGSTWECVCDPTPGQNGETDYSGDEFSFGECKMKLAKVFNPDGSVRVAFSCITTTCPQPCQVQGNIPLTQAICLCGC